MQEEIIRFNFYLIIYIERKYISIGALERVFTKEFLEANKHLDNMDDIYVVAVKEDASITREEFDDFITKVSEAIDISENGEIDESALDSVFDGDGGITFEVFTCLTGICYRGGEAIGRAIYYWRHR